MESLNDENMSNGVGNIANLSDSQGVVSICSPVNTALAPAMKHRTCSDSGMVFLPAANRMIVAGITIRAVAIVRTRAWYPVLYSPDFKS